VTNVYHPMFGIQIDYVDRELHSDRVNALRGRDPKTAPVLKIFRSFSEQALHSSPRRVRQLDLRRQDGLFAPIQQLILQRLSRLSVALLSLTTSTAHDDDHNQDHSNHTQDYSKSSRIHLFSPFIGSRGSEGNSALS
jgi:hypothetical protein